MLLWKAWPRQPFLRDSDSSFKSVIWPSQHLWSQATGMSKSQAMCQLIKLLSLGLAQTLYLLLYERIHPRHLWTMLYDSPPPFISEACHSLFQFWWTILSRSIMNRGWQERKQEHWRKQEAKECVWSQQFPAVRLDSNAIIFHKN